MFTKIRSTLLVVTSAGSLGTVSLFMDLSSEVVKLSFSKVNPSMKETPELFGSFVPNTKSQVFTWLQLLFESLKKKITKVSALKRVRSNV
jgi:hypothetical protein